MLERFFELVEPIKKLIDDEFDDTLSLPKKSTIAQLTNLFAKMKDFYSVTLKLQLPRLTLLDVRKLFDFTISSYPSMSKYLDSRADIVTSPDFESALVKLLLKVNFLCFIHSQCLTCFLLLSKTCL